MGKNIVVCFDGTANELGDQDSNVLKLHSLLKRGSNQIAFYHPGLGTEGEVDRPTFLGRAKRKLKSVAGLMFGYGIMSNIARGYIFLMNVYEDGDQVFIFGFSRGAYSAKVLCALLKAFGLLEKGNEHLVDYLTELIQARTPNFRLISRYRRQFGRECRPHFVGLWDAVSSVRYFFEKKRAIPYTDSGDGFDIGRHAISIDERRAFFRTHLWTPKGKANLKQVLFVGDHSDVGGGHENADPGLSNQSLSWMVSEAESAGLRIDQGRRFRLLKSESELNSSLIHDESRKLSWRFLEFIPKKYWDMKTRTNKWIWPRRARRCFPDGMAVHESVLKLKGTGLYFPPNLPTAYQEEK